MSPATSVLTGCVGGRYDIEARIGQGGMGAVYRARDLATGELVALKVLLESGREETLRFRREFHTLAGLRHPRIVTVFEYGVDGARAYYTMELLSGSDLRERGVQTPVVAASLLRDVASALAILHSRRLIHRDVTPRNVRLTDAGVAKLIDFGVLATVGVAGELAGVPSSIAPEAFLGMPLDHRADIFSLGALGYWLLTGRHAYPGRKLEDVPPMWLDPLAPPSTFAPDVPKALDALVLSMLSREPLARPASAAEVIDRLEAATGLERVPELETARGYLASAAMVGRRREMARLRATLDVVLEANEARGASVEAPTGTGKSRLLREFGREAQLAGTAPVYVACEAAERGFYGLAGEIVRSILGLAPVAAAAAMVPHAPVLAHIVPDLERWTGPVERAAVAQDPVEQRVLIATAFVAFVRALSRAKPLVLIVDDIQRADEASLAALVMLLLSSSPRARGGVRPAGVGAKASDPPRAGSTRPPPLLGEQGPVMLVVGLRTDEPPRAPVALAALPKDTERVVLRGLGEQDVADLVRAIFGELGAATERLAGWVRAGAGGSPLLCSELLRHLIEHKIVRYEGGVWNLPSDLSSTPAPSSLRAMLDAGIAELPPVARTLGEALAILGGTLSLARVIALAGTKDESAVFGALDVLVEREVLVGTAGTYRFRHDGFREALLRTITLPRKAALHLAAAGILIEDASASHDRDEEIGWHLVQGGRRREGAERLERAGLRLAQAQALRDALRPLAEACDVYEELFEPPRRTLDLRRQIVIAAVFVDPKMAIAYGEPALDRMWPYAGLDVAERLGPYVGRHLALMMGLATAAFRWLFSSRAKRGPTPMTALVSALTIATSLCGVYSHLWEFPRLRSAIARLRPMEVFTWSLMYGAIQMARALLALPEGCQRTAAALTAKALACFEGDRLSPVNDLDLRNAKATALCSSAWIRMFDQDPGFEAVAAAVEAYDIRNFYVATDAMHALYHRSRGEEDAARAGLVTAERGFKELGGCWFLESIVVWHSTLSFSLTRDVMGLRWCIDELAQRERSGIRVEPFLRFARGEYHRERGELDLALKWLRGLVAEIEGPSRLLTPAHAALAETLLAKGDVAEAQRVASDGAARSLDADVGNRADRFRCECVLSSCEAAQGSVDAARKRIDAAIVAAADMASPVVLGSLHEAGAALAVREGDTAALQRHIVEVGRCFLPTLNPALVARYERTAQLDRSALSGTSKASPRDAADQSTMAAAPGAIPASRGRAESLIEALIASSWADAAWLYVLDGPELCRVGDTESADIPPTLPPALSEIEERSARSHSPAPGERRILRIHREDRLVGAVLFRAGAMGIRDPPPELLDRVAGELLAMGSRLHPV